MQHDPPLTSSACSGFTLLEALLTLLILGFGLVAVARLQTTVLIEGQQTKSLAEAATLARSQIESLRFAANLYSAPGESASGQKTHSGLHETYHIKWQLRPAPDNAFTHTEVSVLWTDRFGSHTTRLATLLMDPAPFPPALPPTKELPARP